MTLQISGKGPALGKNLIINGNFDIWQYGNSRNTAMANPLFTADRWKIIISDGLLSADRSSTVPTAGGDAVVSNYSLKVTASVPDAIAAAQFNVISQLIEGYNFKRIAERKSFTVSFWVRSSITGTYCVSVQNSGQDRSFIREYTISAANTWEKKTLTFDASPSAGTWNYGNGIGLYLHFVLGCGSNFQSTAGSWLSSDKRATSNQVDWLNNAGATFYIAQVQLEEGGAATAFESRDIGTEILLCTRYYQKSFPIGTPAAQNGGTTGVLAYTFSSSADPVIYVPFNTPMRSAPTITFYNPSAANAKARNLTDASDSGDCSASYTSEKGFAYLGVFVGPNDGSGDDFGVHYSADAEL